MTSLLMLPIVIAGLLLITLAPEANAQLYPDLPAVAPDNTLEQLGIVETPPQQQQSTIVSESMRVLEENTNIMNFFSSVIDTCMLKTQNADIEGIKLCLEFEKGKGEAMKVFLRENQNLTNQILYGG